MQLSQNARNTIACIAWHLAGQRAKSCKPDLLNRRGATCLYRDPVGRKCAVGVLIPDSLYAPNMEMGVLYFLPGGRPEAIASGIGEHLIGFFGGDAVEARCVLTSAQHYHDAGRYEEDMFVYPESAYSRYEFARVVERSITNVSIPHR